MPIPDRLIWPVFPMETPPILRRYLSSMQDVIEEYLLALQADLLEIAHMDIGLQDRWSALDAVYYDADGLLHFHVDGIDVCWFDWEGNLHRNVNIDNLSTNLTKTNTRQLAAYDRNTETIDIFHDGAQVIQMAKGEIIIDNAYALLTGKTLDAATSLSWIDEALDASGALTTFICAKEHRVLEVKGTDVKISGALKVA